MLSFSSRTGCQLLRYRQPLGGLMSIRHPDWSWSHAESVAHMEATLVHCIFDLLPL